MMKAMDINSPMPPFGKNPPWLHRLLTDAWGPPELDVLAHRSQLGHAHQHVEHPVVPAGQEARVTAPVFVREVAERAGHRFFDDHLAELAHDQERDETGDRVAQDHRRPRRLEYPGRTEEQPRAYRPAQGDQLNMPVLQATLEACRVNHVIRH